MLLSDHSISVINVESQWIQYKMKQCVRAFITLINYKGYHYTTQDYRVQ